MATLASELRLLDPCMGSGHFLTFALPILPGCERRRRGYPARCNRRSSPENIFGLELDARCSQIAAFNLALTAWRLAGKYFHFA